MSPSVHPEMWENWSRWLDREHGRCRFPSRICAHVGDAMVDAMLAAGL